MSDVPLYILATIHSPPPLRQGVSQLTGAGYARHRMIRKEAWSFYRTISVVRICGELEEPKGPQGRSHFEILSGSTRYTQCLQGYVAHKKTPTPL